VRAVTTAEGGVADDPGFPLAASRRDLPRAMRLPGGAYRVLAAARGADVIYAIGMYGRSGLASRVFRVPLVIKLASDPAYERARSLGAFSGTVEEFQRPQRGATVRALKRWRHFTISRAARLIIPSSYLADVVARWGVPPERISVIPNPAPAVDRTTPRDALREELGLRSPTFVFAGRLVAAKNLPLLLAGLEGAPGASLVVIGEGPMEDELARGIAENGLADRVSMKGALPREAVIDWLRAADAAVLSSDRENFPHSAVEALAAGTPVIATSVGGVPEIVESGVNGILVPPRDRDALGQAMASLIADDRLLSRLREGALASSARFGADVAFAAIESELERAARQEPTGTG
jgi:glycosyltransferase involved in cell wall biosynthesis